MTFKLIICKKYKSWMKLDAWKRYQNHRNGDRPALIGEDGVGDYYLDGILSYPMRSRK